MRVVSIFGGTGFIGTELIHELEKKKIMKLDYSHEERFPTP